MGAQPKARTAACVSIAAVAGCTQAGFCVQPLVKGIPPTSATLSWDFESQGRCREMKSTHFFPMRKTQIFLLLAMLLLVRNAEADSPRVVDLKTPDGTILKASYFAAAKPGPGVLLFHQSNRTRKSWEDIARQLVAVGINALTVDTDPNKTRKQRWPGDLDAAFEFLTSQSGVKRDVIGIGGAGVIGVEDSVETARRHPAEVKSLVLLSGETESLDFLRQASQLPELFVVADDDEYPPIVEAMELLYVTASSPSRKFVHYSASHEAPWLWYEPFDIGRVPANGGHGTDMFKVHPELPGIIVDWFVTTLIKTPGHAPADTVASAAILNQLWTSEGVARVTQQLTEARQKDPKAQLFPEVTVDIIASDHLPEGDAETAIEIFKLNLLAYPDFAVGH